MAWSLDIVRGATTYNISNGEPFSVDGAELGGAAVRVIEESGPYQDGATHLDDRLEPDTFALKINVVGASASTLDGYRDTLNKIFKPVRGVPITLKVTRDDGSVRQLDTWRTGKLAIPLVTEQKAGNLHRAVVMLRASEPTWYDPTANLTTFLSPTDTWWLGYGQIGTADVMTHVTLPAQGSAWSLTGTVAPGSAFTVFFRSEIILPTGTDAAFSHVSDGSVLAFRALESGAGSPAYIVDWPGQANAIVSDATGEVGGVVNNFVQYENGTATYYRNGTVAGTAAVAGTVRMPYESPQSYWRSYIGGAANDPWEPAMPNAAIYKIALNSEQRALIGSAITIGTSFATDIVYAGDYDSYPVITISGQFNDPVITNTTTGDVLDFTGGTVGSAEVWTIDTRYGRKSVLSGTVNKESYLSTDSDLTTFRLVPDPVASGGTNTISLAGSVVGTAALVTISYYNRYMGY